MIVTELNYSTDLDRGVVMLPLKNAFLSGDQEAHRFIVKCYRDNPRDSTNLTGAGVTGYFIRADGSTVVIDGTVSDGKAVLELPGACYAFPGRFSLVIKASLGDVIHTILWVEGAVSRSHTDKVIDPGEVVPTLDELLAKISTMEQATAAAQNVVSQYDSKVAEQDGKISQLSSEIDDVEYRLSESITDIKNSTKQVYKGNSLNILNPLDAKIIDFKAFPTNQNIETIDVYVFANMIDLFGWLDRIGQQYTAIENGFATNLSESNNMVYTVLYEFETVIPELTVNGELSDSGTGAFIQFFDSEINVVGQYGFNGEHTYQNVKYFRLNFTKNGTISIKNLRANVGKNVSYSDWKPVQKATVNVDTQTGWERLKAHFPVTNIVSSALADLECICSKINTITPQLFGAIGDGKHDDTDAFVKALQFSDCVYVPSGMYNVSKKIVLGRYKSLVGLNPTTTDNTTIVFNSDSADNVGVWSSRYNNISNITLVGRNKVGAGLVLASANSDCHMCTFNNLVIAEFESGLYSSTNHSWDLAFGNVKISECVYGINFKDNNVSCFSLVMTNVYTDHCTYPLYAVALSCIFNGCNFGIINELSFDTTSGCRLTFNNCNFECDAHVTGNNEIFRANGESYIFNNCTFRISATSSNVFVSTGSNVASFTLNSCAYSDAAIGGNSLGNFFDRGSRGVKYGCIVIGKGCYSIIRPQPYDLYLPYFTNEDDNCIVQFNASYIDKNKLVNGAFIYEVTSKTPCYFDGTNVRSIIDGSVVV